MFCVVLSQWNGIYTLRHVLCDIDPSKNLQQVKENYYRDFYRFDTDEFHLSISVTIWRKSKTF